MSEESVNITDLAQLDSFSDSCPATSKKKRPGKSLGRKVVCSPDIHEVVAPADNLESARQKLTSTIQNIVPGAILNGEESVIALRATTGAGKTLNMLECIKRYMLSVEDPLFRALLLFPTKTLVDEFKRNFTDATTGALYKWVGIASARSDKPDNPGYCKEFAKAQIIGANRQRVTHLCSICAHRNDCRYHESHDALRQKKLVLATHHTYLRDRASDLERFDLVVADENILGSLIEKVSYNVPIKLYSPLR